MVFLGGNSIVLWTWISHSLLPAFIDMCTVFQEVAPLPIMNRLYSDISDSLPTDGREKVWSPEIFLITGEMSWVYMCTQGFI